MKKLGLIAVAVMFLMSLAACKKQEAPKQETPAPAEQKAPDATTAPATPDTTTAPATPDTATQPPAGAPAAPAK